MDKKIIIVKIQNTLIQALNFLEESLNRNVERYYSVNLEDTPLILENDNLNCNTVFVAFQKNEEEKKDTVLSLYIGKGCIEQDRIGWKITYNISKKITSSLVIRDFLSNSELDLRNDFDSHSYISIESSKELIRQINLISSPSYQIPRKDPIDQKYSPLDSEERLHLYSQYNQHCIRPIGTIVPQENRGEFQRDYERIVHSKAYRRLVDKAQIFTSTKGDYYRTRMTHTLEVAQISRAIATGLNLNANLTEAIALAHDLGHTPFGHQGERTLDNILKNKIEIIKGIPDTKNFFGGFKHNFQGLRVASCLEEKYTDFPGIDLSYQVLEGILKHTKVRLKACNDCTDSDDCKSLCFSIEDFLPEGEPQYLYLEYPYSTTLEGQILAISDEIAQRGHDLDDSFSANLLTAPEIIEHLSLKKMASLKEKLINMKTQVDDAQNRNRLYIDVDELTHSRIVSTVIEFFINDVITNTSKKMNDFDEDEFYRAHHRFSKKIVDFSYSGKILCDYLEKIISKIVINSPGVVQFDNKAEQIVQGLFTAYYNNPKLLHKGTLRRIYIEMYKSCENVIDFLNGDHNVVRDEIKMIVKADLNKLLTDGTISVSEKDNYEKKKKILVRSIADFISGMTDSYAINEYNKIFLP